MKQQQIIDCYNKTAAKYAENMFDELSKKPLDRLLLNEFAKANKNKGRTIDLGCGPGQTTRFLYEAGITDILGTDLSDEMVKTAQKLNPAMRFEVADMLQLQYPDSSSSAAVAFYSIVHFTVPQLKKAFSEIHRILKANGQFLFSFHIGRENIHLDQFLESEVDIDFYFFETEQILKLINEEGFVIKEAIERFPYKDVEHPSKRAYIWIEKQN